LAHNAQPMDRGSPACHSDRMVLLWAFVGIAVLGIVLVIVGRWRDRGQLPFVRHHQNPQEKSEPRIPGVGENPGDVNSAGYPGGLDSL
jgi:hypothetical protein